MATPYRMHVSAPDAGLLPADKDETSAAKVTELLQKDLESHHVFFNDMGFHNHIVHQLLTLYGTGAGPALLQKAYDKNKDYQIKASAADAAVVTELQADWTANAPKYLGLGAHYADFLCFFQRQIDSRGWQAVLATYLCGDDVASPGLLDRLYAGLFHPLIHLLYAIEWAQPALVAEALAQTAVHNSSFGEFLARVEAVAAAAGPPTTPPRPLPAIYETLRHDAPVLVASARFGDFSSLYKGLLSRAEDEVVALLSQIRVGPDDDLDERTVEMLHTAAYVVAAASYNPPYLPKFDFGLLHPLTSAPFFLLINKLDFVPASAKVRMLEWKMRSDVLQYIVSGSPPLSSANIKAYRPRDANPVSHARDLIPRFHAIVDDGHTIKTVRSLLLAQDESRRWAGRPWIRIDDDMWLNVMYMLLRGVEGQEVLWLRSVGFPEAWQDVPKETG